MNGSAKSPSNGELTGLRLAPSNKKTSDVCVRDEEYHARCCQKKPPCRTKRLEVPPFVQRGNPCGRPVSILLRIGLGKLGCYRLHLQRSIFQRRPILQTADH